MFNAVACSARCGLVASIEIEVGVKRRVIIIIIIIIIIIPWGRVAGRPEMTLEAQSLAYIPGVCVFPARSGFSPGWAYVLVGGCAACLICPRLGTCRIFDVLHCTSRRHSQNTMSLLWEYN